MIKKDKLKPISDGPQKEFEDFRWESMTAEDLVHYRDEIIEALKKKMPLTLQDLDLEQELLIQFSSVRALQTDIIEDEEIPPNQRAQVANSVSSILGQLVERQNTVYTSERFKRIEAALIRWLSSFPDDVARSMLESYSDTIRAIEGRV